MSYNGIILTSNGVNLQINEQKLDGLIIGTPGSWSGGGNDITKVFDGDVNSFFDAPTGVGGEWVGLDLGMSIQISKIRYYPRATFADRMVNGYFQGSNVSDFSTGTTLSTITVQPPYSWTDVFISDETKYRYVRYVAPLNGYGNIAEMEIYGFNI
jgi:hypothetical protein